MNISTYHTKTLGAHQISAVEVLKDHPCLGLAYDVGTGKTAIALTYILDLLRSGEISDALVVVPASLIPNWEKDIDEFTDFDHVEESDVALLKQAVTIRSYQKTYKAETRTVTRGGQPAEVRDYALRDDVDRYWGAIVYDEAHAISSHRSRQTQAALALSQLTQRRVIMTGTPIEGSSSVDKDHPNVTCDYSKLYGQLKFLEPAIWKNWSEFCRRYVLASNKFYKPILYREKELQDLMQRYYLMCRLDDCFDLPSEIMQVIPCQLAEKKAYKDIKEQLIADYGLTRNVSGSYWGKLMQLCSGHFKNEDGLWSGKCNKEDIVRELLDSIPKQIIIFAKFTESIDRLYRICQEKGRNPIIFDGRSKYPTWKDFTDGKNDILIIQYQAGGAGLNLQCASTMILYEPPTSVKDLTQAKGRIRRPGQTDHSHYIILKTVGTVEGKEWDAKLESKEVTEELKRQWLEGDEI